MMKSVMPSGVDGAVDAPPSKSMMQRALIAAALAEGGSEIANPTFCDDAHATMGAVGVLGAEVGREGSAVIVSGGGKPRGGTIDCGESGTCMRMITPVAALYDVEFTLTGRGSLMERPMGMMDEPLRMLGAGCRMRNGKPPITVKGPLHGGKVEVDGSESSQFVSGLLMALPLCMECSEVRAGNLKSAQYVSMTLDVLERFGVRVGRGSGAGRFVINGGQRYKARKIAIEGDWSGAAFMLVAGAVAGRATVRNLAKGLQPDQEIVDALEASGVKVKLGRGGARVEGGGRLKAFTFDASGCPDLFPPLAALACSCEGKSAIRGAGRLRHKESDRAAALVSELGKMGADILVSGDVMEITGKRLKGGRVESHGDHRIAMACAVAALASENGAQISGEECISKSYPGFFDDLGKLGAIVK